MPQLWRQGNSNKYLPSTELENGIQVSRSLSLSIAVTTIQRMNVLLPAPCVQIHVPLVLENPSTGMKCIVDAKIDTGSFATVISNTTLKKLAAWARSSSESSRKNSCPKMDDTLYNNDTETSSRLIFYSHPYQEREDGKFNQQKHEVANKNLTSILCIIRK